MTTNPTVLGETSYDYQHNCTMARQVEHRAGYATGQYGGYVHFDWTALRANSDDASDPRGIAYQVCDIGQCNLLFGTGPETRMNNQPAGFCGIDAHYSNPDFPDSGWAVGYAHEDPDNYAGYGYFDAGLDFGIPAGGVFFSDYPSDRHGYWWSNGTGPDNENIWPKGSWDIDGTDQVFHMVCTEINPGPPGEPRTCSYYRRVGPYGAGDGIWSDQRVIDTVMVVGATVASSPISDKVAIVWAAPADYVRDTEDEFKSQYENDIWFAIATDNGLSWAGNPTSGGAPSIGYSVDHGLGGGYNPPVGGNLTTYDQMSRYRAYCDLSVLWSVKDAPDDYLQIAWGCRQWKGDDTLFRRNGAIFHWNQKYLEVRQVIRADWDTGGACVAHAWGTDVAKHTITECDGRLYITFTQFGFPDEPCGVYNTSVGPNGYVISGQLYTTVYDESYHAWDRPQVTMTDDTLAHGSDVNQPTCVPDSLNWVGSGVYTVVTDGDCSSEYWSSMARYGRVDTCSYDPNNPYSVYDVIYIDDQAPGGCVQTESGAWVMNPVNWYVGECRQAVPEPGFDVFPIRFGICYDQPIIVLGTTDNTSANLTLENPGLLDNAPVTITPTYVSGGNGGTSVTATPNSGITISAAGDSVPVTLDITTTGEDEFVTVFFDIEIVHHAGATPPTTEHLPMCITVTDNYVPLEHAVIRTACKRLRVFNSSRMSNNSAQASLNMMDDPCINLYDGSKIICRPTTDSVMCWFSVFDQFYGSERAILQASPIFVDSISHPDYTYATYEAMTADSAIGLIVEYFAPTDTRECDYMIIKQRIFNRTDIPLTGITWGDALDWDLPGYENNSGKGVLNDNFPGQDPERFLVWITNAGDNPAQTDPYDTLSLAARHGAIAAAINTGAPQDLYGFKNYLVLENDQFVYQSGDEAQAGNPYPPTVMYNLMANTNGYYYSRNPPADTGEDLNIVVTIGFDNLGVDDTICAVKIVATALLDWDAYYLKYQIDRANDFVAAHDEIKCRTGCFCLPGDANGDEAHNVGDAVYIIDYVFKGGSAPTPYYICSGDANGDCSVSVGDAVYMVNYVFKGGPPPVGCEEWVASCGQYE